MRDSLEKEWTEIEIEQATKIVQIVWEHQPRSVGKAFLATAIGLKRDTVARRANSIKRIEYLMPLVVSISAKAHIGHTIIPIVSGNLLFTSNAGIVFKKELVRIYQIITKLKRVDDSFGVLKESPDVELRNYAYQTAALLTMFLNQEPQLKEILVKLGLFEE